MVINIQIDWQQLGKGTFGLRIPIIIGTAVLTIAKFGGLSPSAKEYRKQSKVEGGRSS